MATMVTTDKAIDGELVRSADEWADVIRADLGRAVDDIVSAGQHLIAAKADVRHGEWLPMLKQIGISARQAQRLMSIGENPALSNATSSTHLPSALESLYELSRLPADTIEHGITNGHITPDMTIRDAKDLVADVRGQHDQAPGGVTDRTPGQCSRVADALDKARAATVDDTPTDDDAGEAQEPGTPDDAVARVATDLAKAVNHLGDTVDIFYGVMCALPGQAAFSKRDSIAIHRELLRIFKFTGQLLGVEEEAVDQAIHQWAEAGAEAASDGGAA